jgi:hypothetical protein
MGHSPIFGVIIMAAGMLAIAGRGTAWGLNACSESISQCGCSIDSAGVFTTTGPLSSASLTDDCIDIAANGAVLILFGDITGPGGAASAAGIHILSSASNAFVTGRTTPGSGAHFSVSGFATGIQNDASNVEIDQLDATGNVTNGVVFNGTTGSDYDDSAADDNKAGAGVLINGGSSNLVADSEADLNNNGVEVSGAANNRIVDSGAGVTQGGNDVYGFWITQSSGNHIKDSAANNNGGTGTYLGCFPRGGPSGQQCPPGTKPSKFNRIISSGGNKNSGAGIGVDRGDSVNVFDENGGRSNIAKDAVDKNKKCDRNIWMKDDFGTTSRACIH